MFSNKFWKSLPIYIPNILRVNIWIVILFSSSWALTRQTIIPLIYPSLFLSPSNTCISPPYDKSTLILIFNLQLNKHFYFDCLFAYFFLLVFTKTTTQNRMNLILICVIVNMYSSTYHRCFQLDMVYRYIYIIYLYVCFVCA